MAGKLYPKRTDEPSRGIPNPNNTTEWSAKYFDFFHSNIQNALLDRGYQTSDLENEANDNLNALGRAISRNIAEANYLNCSFSTSGGVDKYTLTHPSGITRRITDLTTNVFSVEFAAAASNTVASVEIAINGWNGSVAKPLYYYDKTTSVPVGSLVSGYVYKALYDPSLNGGSGAFYLVSSSKGMQDAANLTQASTTQQGISYLSKPEQFITISNNATDPNNAIDFSAGNFNFSDGSRQAAASAMTKRLDASWAAGNNQGGLFSGTKQANSTYHCFEIYNPTTGASDCGFLLGVANTTPNPTSVLPSGYTKWKRVASLCTDPSGNIRQGTWYSDNSFSYRVPIESITAASQTVNNESLRTIQIPLGIKTKALVAMKLVPTNAVTGEIRFKHYSADASTPTLGSSDFTAFYLYDASSGTVIDHSNAIPVMSNTSSQIKTNALRVSGSNNANITLMVEGWVDYTL